MTTTAWSRPAARADVTGRGDGRSSHRRVQDTARGWWPSLGGLATLVLLLPLHDVWAAQAVAVAIVLIVPGYLLLRAIGVTTTVVVANVALVPVASLAVLTATGLALTTLGPQVGLSEPLRPLPAVVLLELVCVGLFLAAGRRGQEIVPASSRFLTRPADLAPVVLPVLAVVGALELNAGGPGVAAGLTVVGIGLGLALGLMRAGRLPDPQVMLLLYCVSLAALWAVSLRSDFVFGWDVVTEVRKAQETVEAGWWDSMRRDDAYGALLSVTVLPAQITALTGISAAGVLKIVFPAVFSVFAVAVYSLARHFVPGRWAVLAVALVLVQRNFAQQLPGLGRQQIALLFFVALLIVVLRLHFARIQQLALVGLFGAMLVVSHYSTTYLTIGLLAAALMITAFAVRIRRTGTWPLVLLGFTIMTLVTLSVIWYGVVTQSASNVAQFTDRLSAEGLSVLPNWEPGQNPLQTFLTGNAASAGTAAQYQADALTDLPRSYPYVTPLPEGADPAYALQDVPDAPMSLAELVLGWAATAAQQAVYVLAAVGAVSLAFGRSSRLTERLLGAAALAGLGVLAALRVSGTLATLYNQDRALFQVLVPLGIAAVWTLHRLSARGAGGWRHVLRPAAGAAVALLFLTGSGVVSTVTGSGPVVNLANRGEDYERFYVTGPEVAAAEWLGRHAPADDLVYADRYGLLRILLATGRVEDTVPAVTPPTLDRHAWVYASHANTRLGHARAQLNGSATVYRFPERFLADHYDRLYSNGFAEVYRR